jgi:tripartite-type tricarboxylate transporter receptor subunit TctC
MRPVIIALLAAALAVANPAIGQEWPQRPVKIVVPYAAGGNTDVIARITAERLAAAFSQPFLVENRGGAGGALAADYVAKQPADGYTLFLGTLSQLGTVPHTQKVNYDALKDFTPISNIGANGFVIVINSNVPVKDLKGFVEYVKARPGKLNYGSGGSGSLTQLAAALLLQRAGIDMVHVPYKGGAPAVADTISGQVQMYAGSPSELIAHVGGGKLEFLGITAERRNPSLPNVPAVNEIYPGFNAVTWNGLLGPANLPEPIVRKLSQEIQRSMKDPAFLDRLAKMGLDPVPTTPAQFAAQIRNEYAMWGDVIKKAGIKPE